ncbi:MAG: solute carrier family 23 protein, partial [Pseudomonadales bacterium]|nr:solute carrier family 23 protein [Pseudomonadales bacterium]
MSTLVHGLEDRPPLPVTVLAAVQHLLGVFVSVATVPLIISLGMGLSADDAAYMVGASLVVSGVATLLQVTRPGPLGSGLLSVQGTSFAFVGPFIYLASQDPAGAEAPTAAWLGALFGSAALCSLFIMVLSRGLHRLGSIVTPTVTGCTILVIGVSLTLVTIDNMLRVHTATIAAGASLLVPWGLFAAVVTAIVAVLASGRPALRVNAVFLGLGVGVSLALVLGVVDAPDASTAPLLFVVEPLRWPLSVDLSVVLVLLPIFVVSAVESVGDLTATAALSGRPVTGEEYWERLRGGILGDGFNSLLASLCCTFPNTTFSQNNGVIRVTGIASRRVGVVLALLLVALGTLPTVARWFLLLPEAVLNGVTGVMFFMVGVAGVAILRDR